MFEQTEAILFDISAIQIILASGMLVLAAFFDLKKERFMIRFGSSLQDL